MRVEVSEMFKVDFKCVNKSNNPNPEYSKEGDSGFDIRAFLDKEIIIQPMKRALIPTGLYFDLPRYFELQVRSRSGLAIKNGVFVLNSPGTVDEMYTGEVCIILMNLGDEPFVVKNGDRIAQGVFASVVNQRMVNIEFINEIDKQSERGSNGFGSTGKD